VYTNNGHGSEKFPKMQSTKEHILAHLKRTGGSTVEGLAVQFGLARMTVRQHLAALERDGLVRSREERRPRGRPHLLFLDEPTTGLDPRSRLGMWDVIRGLVREGTTLLLTTQYLEEADELADTIAVVDHGRIIASGTADQLKAKVGGERIEVVVHDRAEMTRARAVLLRDGQRDVAIDEHTRKLTVPATGGAQHLIQVVRDLDEAGVHIDDIALRRPTLDDVFLALTGHAAAETTPEAEAIAGQAGRRSA